jgi:thiamine kinase-like enzyme
MKFRLNLILNITLFCLSQISASQDLDAVKENIAAVVASNGYKVVKVQSLLDAGPSFINDIFEVLVQDNKGVKPLIIKLISKHWGFKKLSNEVNVLNFLKSNSSIPVPKVLAHSTDLNKSDDIGYYYILMEKVQGKVLSSFWNELTPSQQDKLSRMLQKHITELHNLKFSKIGSFANLNKMQPSEIIETPDNHLPFANNFYEYVASMAEYYLKIIDSNDKDISSLVRTYSKVILEKLRLEQSNDNKQFSLCHQDLSLKNIMATKDSITAILDWEWAASQPRFMEIFSSYDWLPNTKQKMEFQKQGKVTDSNLNAIKLLHVLYSLACFHEWFEIGKLKHTARFLKSKVLQRKVKKVLPTLLESETTKLKQSIKEQLIMTLKEIVKL